MTPLEHLNRPQMRRDRLHDWAERLGSIFVTVLVLGGTVYVGALFAQMIDLLNRSW